MLRAASEVRHETETVLAAPLRRLGGRPPDSNMVIRRAEMLDCDLRRYAGRMASLVPQHMALEEVVHASKGIGISSIVSLHVSCARVS